MAETIRKGCDGSTKWHWYNVKGDLVQQGKLNEEDVVIDPLSVKSCGCGGTFLGQLFFITWAKDTFLLLSMAEFSTELVQAFATIVGYEPFARYERGEYTTIEWDKTDPEGRWDALQGEWQLTRFPT